VLIVPLCGEQPDCLQQLSAKIRGERYLIIACVNRPENHPKTETWYRDNKDLITHLKGQALSIKQIEQGYLLSFERFDVWLLDFNDQPFDVNQGVGLARKIATDSALQLINDGVVKSPWIFSTDADVQLPADYFQIVGASQNTVAYSLKFQHTGLDTDLNYWQSLYDFKLRYYQQAMRYIGAGYDYIPLGSCLIVKADAYTKVRGFPIRSGGEDFYLLNKLAKLGDITQPDKPVIKIKARLSQRVPFGTGPALLKIKESPESVCFYHPQVFVDIKMWYQQLCDFYDSRLYPENLFINQFWNIEAVINKALQQTKTQKRWQQFVLEWFDAFKILKTVHGLEQCYPRLTLDQLRETDGFCGLAGNLDVPGCF
jgi:hypothetical protein